MGNDGELVLERAACSLADVLHERGPLPEGEVRTVGAAAAAALARVHEAGIVHGDVKPANLLLSRDGELWLADFDTAPTADGRPLEHFSPQRLPAGAPALPATDISALALALVELSTGTRLDPRTAWRAADLRRLGCSPSLSTDIAFMLGGSEVPGGSGPSLDARSAADRFERGGTASLPSPALQARRIDPTPTVEFMSARPTPPGPPDRPGPATGHGPLRWWWQRLAASWRPPGAPAAPRRRSPQCR